MALVKLSGASRVKRPLPSRFSVSVFLPELLFLGDLQSARCMCGGNATCIAGTRAVSELSLSAWNVESSMASRRALSPMTTQLALFLAPSVCQAISSCDGTPDSFRTSALFWCFHISSHSGRSAPQVLALELFVHGGVSTSLFESNQTL